MPTVNITPTDQTKDWSAHRIGLAFSEQTILEVMDRDPYGHLLCFVLPKRALGNGFDLVHPEDSDSPSAEEPQDDESKNDKKPVSRLKQFLRRNGNKNNNNNSQKGSPLDNNDDIWKVLKDPWKKIVDSAASLERGYGSSFPVIYKNDNSNADENHKLFVKVFRPEQVDDTKLKYNKDETIAAIAFKEPDPKGGADKAWEVKDLADLYYNIHRQKQDWWDGRSYLEPIWDEIQGLRAIRMGAVLFAIRVGAGLKIVKVPPNTPAAVLAEIKEAAKRLDSLNGWFILPLDEAEVTIESGTGMVDYHALKRVCLEAITAYTGLPMASLTGIEQERQGADFNQMSEDDYKRELQRQYEDLANWLILRFNELYDWGLSEDSYDIKWRIHEEISDKAQAETDVIRATADATDITSLVLSPQEVRDIRGIIGPAPEPRPAMSFNIKDQTDQDKKEIEA